MLKKVALFDSFAYACNYSDNGCTLADPEGQNEDDEDNERGICSSSCCPLGRRPEAEDLDNPNIDWGDTTHEDCTCDGKFDGSEYLIIDVGPDATKDEIAAWEAYDRYMNRYNRK